MKRIIAIIAMVGLATIVSAQDRFQRVGMFVGGVPNVQPPREVSAATLPEATLRQIFEERKGDYCVVQNALVGRDMWTITYPDVPGFTARLLTLKVMQVVNENTALLTDEKGVVYAMETPEAARMYKGQELGARWCRPDGVYRYVTVMGAPEQVRKIVLEEVREPTFEDFMNHLRRGGRVSARLVVKESCPECNGEGFMPRQKGKLGRPPCPRCRTQKTVQVEREVWVTR